MARISEHPDGRPVMFEIDIEELEHRFTLTRHEALEVWERVRVAGEDEAAAVEAVKAFRASKRVHRETASEISGRAGVTRIRDLDR